MLQSNYNICIYALISALSVMWMHFEISPTLANITRKNITFGMCFDGHGRAINLINGTYLITSRRRKRTTASSRSSKTASVDERVYTCGIVNSGIILIIRIIHAIQELHVIP